MRFKPLCIAAFLALLAVPAPAQEQRPLVPFFSPRLERPDPHELIREAEKEALFGRWQQAWQLYTEAIQTHDLMQRDLARAYLDRGRIQLQLNEPHQALADFRRAVELAPAMADTLAHRALAWLALNAPDTALADADQALKMDAGLHGAHLARGRALLDLKRPKEALAALDEAVRLAPRHAECYTHRAKALSALGFYERSKKDAETARRLETESATPAK